MRVCIHCVFSDCSRRGPGLFGRLACFEDNKAAYQAVWSKADLLQIRGAWTEFVQGSYLCPPFERRRPDAGYRG